MAPTVRAQLLVIAESLVERDLLIIDYQNEHKKVDALERDLKIYADDCHRAEQQNTELAAALRDVLFRFEAALERDPVAGVSAENDAKCIAQARAALKRAEET